ncbi:hypothetical protein NTCA1_45270 [Novosphingobium sp. TCA1]|nr:hypothetical protein NTCA1_45270 [Novosphingobium sp. TCA1]
MKSTAATCATEAYQESARLPAPSRKDQLKKGPEAHRRFGAFSLRTPKEVPSKAQTAPEKVSLWRAGAAALTGKGRTAKRRRDRSPLPPSDSEPARRPVTRSLVLDCRAADHRKFAATCANPPCPTNLRHS